MSASTDDAVFDEFVATLDRDARLKQEFVAALRAKNDAGLRQAVRWVFDNLIRPGIEKLRDGAVQAILDSLRQVLGGLPYG